MLRILIVFSFLSVVACNSGFESQNRPYTVGSTTGTFSPVKAGNIPVKIKGSKEIKNNTKKPQVITQFKNLKFTLDIDSADLAGIKNPKAKYIAHLKGEMIIKNKTINIDIKSIFNRFNAEDQSDQLEEMGDAWQFVLVNKDRSFMADVRCIKSWDCKTIVAELYWYEDGVIKRRQYHIEGTLQQQRVESTEEQPVADEHEENSEEEHNHEDEVDVTGENVSEYRFITFTEGYIEPEETIYFEIAEEQVKEDDSAEEVIVEEQVKEKVIIPVEQDIIAQVIESDASMNRPDMPIFDYAIPIGSKERLNLENFVFDFKSKDADFLYGSDLPNQSYGCPAVSDAKNSKCKSGSLANADFLNYTAASDELIGQVPYVSYRSEDKKYGTSVLINLIESTTESFFSQTSKTTYVGDISLINGGKVSGHSSHRNGLDVDLRLITTDNRNAPYDVSNDNFKSLDVPGMYKFIKGFYKSAKVYDSKTQQVYSYVNVFFLHSSIKKRICEQAKLEDPLAFKDPTSDVFQALKRIREPKLKDPSKNSTNHTNHMHIRLNCHSDFCRDYSDKNNQQLDSNGC